MNISCKNCAIAEDEYIAAFRLHSLKPWVVHWSVCAVLVSYLIVCIRDFEFFLQSWHTWFTLSVFGYLIWTTRPKYGLGKQYRSDSEFKEAFSFCCDDEGFQYETALGTSRSDWGTLTKVKHSEEMVLLYQRPDFFQMILRRWFQTDEDWQSLLSKVREVKRRKA
jgi:hypothetical protein